MNNLKKPARVMTENDIRVRISTLWITVMVNILAADIFSFMLPGFLNDIITGNTPFKITQGIMLVFAVVQEIPIAMIFLSRILKYRANRWVNIIASVITIVYVVAGGSPYLHYYFFATIEVVTMLLIIIYAWKLNEEKI
jgi:hypothetical protein